MHFISLIFSKLTFFSNIASKTSCICSYKKEIDYQTYNPVTSDNTELWKMVEGWVWQEVWIVYYYWGLWLGCEWEGWGWGLRSGPKLQYSPSMEMTRCNKTKKLIECTVIGGMKIWIWQNIVRAEMAKKLFYTFTGIKGDGRIWNQKIQEVLNLENWVLT